MEPVEEATADEVTEIDPKPEVEPNEVCAADVEFPTDAFKLTVFLLPASRFAMAANCLFVP